MAPTPVPPRILALLAIGAATVALSGCSLLERITGGGDAARDGEGQVVVGNDSTDVFTLQVGDCLNDSAASDEVDTVPTTPCDEPHDSEVYASVIVSGSDYPGADAIRAEADAECLTEFEPFVGVGYNESIYDYSYYFPTEGSWAEGDREILCVIYEPSGQITGSLAGIGG